MSKISLYVEKFMCFTMKFHFNKLLLHILDVDTIRSCKNFINSVRWFYLEKKKSNEVIKKLCNQIIFGSF